MEGTRYTFKKRERISRRTDFTLAYRKGKRRTGTYYRIFYRKITEHPFPRIGMSVSKAVGKAVRRNYERRIIREFFRLHRHQLPNGDYVVQRISGVPPDFHHQQQELIDLLVKPYERG